MVFSGSQFPNVSSFTTIPIGRTAPIAASVDGVLYAVNSAHAQHSTVKIPVVIYSSTFASTAARIFGSSRIFLAVPPSSPVRIKASASKALLQITAD